jgi:hypothetical protein
MKRGEFSNPLFERARELAWANEFWMIGNAAATAAKAEEGDLPEFFSGVRSFAYGLSIREKTKFDVVLNLRNKEAAETVAAQWDRFSKELGSTIDEKELLEGLRATTTGPAFHLVLDMKPADLAGLFPVMTEVWSDISKADRVIRAAAKTPEPSRSAPPNLNAQTPPTPPPPPARRTVMIYGLDNGPKEVQFTPGKSN